MTKQLPAIALALTFTLGCGPAEKQSDFLLVGDEAAPLISELQAQGNEDSAIITWQTDALADSLVEYGLAPGSYTDSVYDPEYTRGHQLVIAGLLPDTSYNYRVTSADRCGNTASSNCEWGLAPPPTYIYLPLVLRNH